MLRGILYSAMCRLHKIPYASSLVHLGIINLKFHFFVISLYCMGLIYCITISHVVMLRRVIINFNKPSFGAEKILLITSDKPTPCSAIDCSVILYPYHAVLSLYVGFLSAHIDPQRLHVNVNHTKVSLSYT